MDQERMRRCLAQGLGRVVPFLGARDAAPYRAAVLHACAHNTAFDPQVEGSRAVYMRDVIRATGEVAYYREGILAALAAVTEHWDAVQLFHFARLFAEAGDGAARAALYAKFARDDAEQRFAGGDELVALDGLAGFLAAARHIGAAVRADPELWEDDALLNLARERCGREAVDRVLGEAAATDPDLAAYVRAVRDTAERREAYRSGHPDIAGLGYAEVAARIARQGGRVGIGNLHAWGRAADAASLLAAAADLVKQGDPERLAAYLRLFGRRAYPLDPAPIIGLARHPDEAVAGAALAALRHLADGRVRALAVAILDDDAAAGWRKGGALHLLARNVAAGDEARVAALLAAWRDADADDLHDLGYGALAALEAHPTPEAAPALLALYESGPCSHCRERCVELLHRIGRLPDRITEECRHDANLDLRAKAGSYLREGPAGQPQNA